MLRLRGRCEEEGARKMRHWKLKPPGPSVVTRYDRCHRGRVGACQFRPSMKHLVSGGADGQVLLWSLHERPGVLDACNRPYRFLGHQGPVCAIAVSPLDNVIVSGSKDRTLRFWLPTVCGQSRAIKGHSGAVRTVAFSPNGHHVLSGGDDKMLKVWAVEGRRFLLTLAGHLNWVRSAEFNHDGRLIVSGGDDKTVRLWNFERRECIHVFHDLLGTVNCARFSQDGNCIASGGADYAIQIRDIRTRMLVQHYDTEGGAIQSLCFHPSGHFLLSASGDALRVWDVREGRGLYTLAGHGDGNVTCAAFSHNGEYFTSGTSEQLVMVWRSNLDRSCTGARYNCELQEQSESRSKKHILRPKEVEPVGGDEQSPSPDISVPSDDGNQSTIDFSLSRGDRVRVGNEKFTVNVLPSDSSSVSSQQQAELDAVADEYLRHAACQLSTLRHSIAKLQKQIAPEPASGESGVTVIL